MGEPIPKDNQSAPSQKLGHKLLMAIDLMEFSISLMRQNIARALPGVSPEVVDRELRRWLIEQPQHFVASNEV